jgi:RHS repeat-associated protein
VTRVVQANGWVNDAFHDAKGLITKLVQYAPLGPDRDAVTEYTWDPKWERVTNITYPEGNLVRFAYDTATGNRISEEDGRGASSRIVYAYITSGAAVNLLQRITYPIIPPNSVGAVEEFEYDAVLGNPSATVSPLGFRTTVQRDAAGRDTTIVAPVDSGGTVAITVRRTYDLMDQVTSQRTVARGDTIQQTTTFDQEGNPLTAQTTALPDRNSLGNMTRRYAYDAADRRLTDSVGTKLAARSSYDLASNDTLTLRPGSMSVRTIYDALNRPAQRQALGKISQFSYDPMGNLTAADNPNAQVRRSYFSNGLLRTDSLRISTADTTVANRWAAHVYGLAYDYDLDGRRKTLTYPSQLLPSGATSGTSGYTYDALSGALATVTDPFGNQYRYGYDALDRIRTFAAASFATDTLTYDLESRLTRRTRLAAGQPADVLAYDQRAKVLANAGSGDAATYLPIGPVKTLAVSSEGRTEQYTTDGLGHRRWSSVLAGNQDGATVQWSIFEPVTARLLKTYPLQNNARSDTSFYFYQVDGAHRETNAKHFIWKQQGGGCANSSCLDYTEIHNTLDDYDGEGHLATSTFLLDTLAGTKSLPPTYKPYRVYTTYRYDALGRRVWARTMRGTNCAAKLNVNAVCVSTVTRTVWDGAQVLFEVRAAGDSLAGTAMESDASTDPKYGRVGYVHGLGIDQPLALFKENQLVVPHATWRGVYDRGSCLPSPCPLGLQFPGGNGSASVWGPTGVDPDKADWYGSLIWDQQDATGYQYKRNRYYDPGTGRFTQEDPIGLAGGSNLYGFAAGDAVNFTDPFGLCWPQDDEQCSPLQRLANWAAAHGHTKTLNVAAALQAIGETITTVADALGLGSSVDCEPGMVCGTAPAIGPAFGPRPGIGAIKTALEEVHAEVGNLPKGVPGKFGSPQRGNSVKGYRLDPPDPHRPLGHPESGWHINWWDWTQGSRGAGGRSGAVPIRQ